MPVGGGLGTGQRGREAFARRRGEKALTSAVAPPATATPAACTPPRQSVLGAGGADALPAWPRSRPCFSFGAKELAEQENVDTANTRIIAPALAPDKPTTPRTSLMIAALLAGLACGAALVMLRRYSRVSSNTTAAGRRI